MRHWIYRNNSLSDRVHKHFEEYEKSGNQFSLVQKERIKYSIRLPIVCLKTEQHRSDELDNMNEIGDDYLDGKELNFDHRGVVK